MALTVKEIESKITSFIAINPGCKVRTVVKGLSKRLAVSPTKVSKVYQSMIYDEKKNPDGLISVDKPSGFHGGHEPFKLTLRQTDFKKQIDETTKLLETYENQFHTYFPNLRKGRLLISKSIGGNKFQTINKKHESEFDFLCGFIDRMFLQVAGFSFAKNQGFTPSAYDGIINSLQKRTMTWIIKEINHFLDQQSKDHNVTRCNVLMQFRTKLDWLLNIETKKPDLFHDRKWFKDSVIW